MFLFLYKKQYLISLSCLSSLIHWSKIRIVSHIRRDFFDVFVSKCIQFSALFHGVNAELRFPTDYLTRTRHSVSMNGSTLLIQEYKSRLTATMAKYIDSHTMIMSLTCFIVPKIVNLAAGHVPRR